MDQTRKTIALLLTLLIVPAALGAAAPGGGLRTDSLGPGGFNGVDAGIEEEIPREEQPTGPGCEPGGGCDLTPWVDETGDEMLGELTVRSNLNLAPQQEEGGSGASSQSMHSSELRLLPLTRMFVDDGANVSFADDSFIRPGNASLQMPLFMNNNLTMTNGTRLVIAQGANITLQGGGEILAEQGIGKIGTLNDQPFIIVQNNTTVIQVVQQGNVGINTTEAPEKLTVEGNIAPATNDAWALGSDDLRWNELFLASIINYASDLEYVQDGTSTMTLGTGGNLTLHLGTFVGDGSGLTGITAEAEVGEGDVTSFEILDGTILAADVDTAEIQRRVTDACSNGFMMAAIAADGTVTCAQDQDTTYTAGDRISFVSNVVSLTPCGNDGDILKMSSGQWACVQDADTTYTNGDGLSLTGTVFSLAPCAEDQILKFQSSSWNCAADDVGSSNAETLDGLESGQFLRSDTEDSFTGVRLDVEGSAGLRVNQDISIGFGSGTDNDAILFDQANEKLEWHDTNGRFEFSNGAEVHGPLQAGIAPDVVGYHRVGSGTAVTVEPDITGNNDLLVTNDLQTGNNMYVGGSAFVDGSVLRLNAQGPDGTQRIDFYEDGSPLGENLVWDNGDDRFELSDELYLDGAFQVGGNVVNVPYNRIGTGTPNYPGVDDATDLFVTGHVEADRMFMNGPILRINHDGPDETQRIDFYDNGMISGQSVSWNDLDDRFELSDDVKVWGSLNVDSDIEIGNSVFVDGDDLWMGYDTVGTDQIIHFSNNGTADGASLRWKDTSNRFVVSHLTEFNDNIAVGHASPSTDDFVYFNAGGEWIKWDASADEFELSSDTQIDGDLRVGGPVADAVDERIKFDGGAESIRWVNAHNAFEFTGDIELTDGDDYIQLRTNTFDDIELTRDTGADDASSWFRVFTDGTTYEQMRISDGDEAAANFDGAVNANGLDLAEAYLRTDDVQPGELVSIDPSDPRAVGRAAAGDGGRLLGVMSTAPGFVLSGGLPNEEELADFWGQDVLDAWLVAKPRLVDEILREQSELSAEDSRVEAIALDEFNRERLVDVALAGRVPTRVSAENGEVLPGDALTISTVAGVAMKATAPGPTIGTALEPVLEGEATIEVFMGRGWYGGSVEDMQEALAEKDEQIQDLEARLAALEEAVFGQVDP